MAKKKTAQSTNEIIEKYYGVSQTSVKDGLKGQKFLSTGSLSLDLAMKGRGFPVGKVTEVFGPTGGSKTTLCLKAIAEFQKTGGKVAYIDAENAVDFEWAEMLGVDLDDDAFRLYYPDYGEVGWSIVESLVQGGEVGMIVVDSVAQMTPKVIIDGEMSDKTIGALASMTSKAINRIIPMLKKSDCTLVLINQIRQVVSTTPNSFGPTEYTPGGKALGHGCSLRLKVRRVSKITDSNGEGEGIRTQVYIDKSRVCPPHRKAEYEVRANCGLSRELELLDLGIKHKILSQNGAWYAFGDQKLGNGKEKSREFLVDNPSIAEQIEVQVREKALGVPSAVEEASNG